MWKLNFYNNIILGKLKGVDEKNYIVYWTKSEAGIVLDIPSGYIEDELTKVIADENNLIKKKINFKKLIGNNFGKECDVYADSVEMEISLREYFDEYFNAQTKKLKEIIGERIEEKINDTQEIQGRLIEAVAQVRQDCCDFSHQRCFKV